MPHELYAVRLEAFAASMMQENGYAVDWCCGSGGDAYPLRTV